MLTDNDIAYRYLPDLSIAVLGYGSQGRSQALNLRDSGCRVVVGLRPESPRRRLAADDKFTVLDIPAASQSADSIFFLIPDEAHAEVFDTLVAPVLKPGCLLVFAHGFSVHYRLVTPSDEMDVVVVAPKGIGPKVREEYLRGSGVPGAVAVGRDATGTARAKALELCKALGFLRCGVVETTVAEETEVDLFTEQAVLCGGLTSLIEAAFDVLVEAGYSPEMAYLECLHEMKLIADMVHRCGIAGMRDNISSVALHGDLFTGPRIVDGKVRNTLKTVLSDIRDGTFFKSYQDELASGRKRTGVLVEKSKNHLIESTGRRIRETMKKGGWTGE